MLNNEYIWKRKIEAFPSNRIRTIDLWITMRYRYSPPLYQLSYRRLLNDECTFTIHIDFHCEHVTIDLWPQQCITFWPGVLPIKFGSHRVFLSNLTTGWPRLTLHDFWPQQCITLRSGVLPTKFGGHRTFLKQLNLWMTFDHWWGSLRKYALKPYPNSKFRLHTSKHDETHSRTNLHIRTYRLGYFSI